MHVIDRVRRISVGGEKRTHKGQKEENEISEDDL
jgi:hypothetical protein